MRSATAVLAMLLLHYSNTFAQDSASVSKKTEPYRLFWTELTPNPEDKADMLLWWLKYNPNGFVWDAIISTAGWAEIDAGYGFTRGNWSFIGMLGSDITMTDGKPRSLIPQLYGIYWNEQARVRFQSWNLAYLSETSSIRLRNFATFHGFGIDTDYWWIKNDDGQFSISPIFEWCFDPGTILIELPYNFQDQSISFKLTYFHEWF